MLSAPSLDFTTTIAAVVPFHTYLWKIASRCNLNCKYCYVYNLADQRWRRQPHFMSEDTARQCACRIREHLQKHDKKDLVIIFHGGEPLLGGIDQLRMLCTIIREELTDYGFQPQLSMQSNLTLLNEEIADFLLENRIVVGTSMDGPAEWNDVFRVDHSGNSSTEATERGLVLISSPKYRKIWSGILCVINPWSDPVCVLDYLRQYSPSMIDLLYPLNHHDNPPRGKETDRDSTPYADWLIRFFDHWWHSGASPEIRTFSSIMRLCCGLESQVESIGLNVIDLVVVETNGDIEGLDSLKSTYDGATNLLANVLGSDFDSVALHSLVRFRQMGLDQLCETCKNCSVVKVCGGGYIPHRYSSRDGFMNPSIYCRDLEKVIRHIHASVKRSIDALA
jgi:uncharacterized protein